MLRAQLLSGLHRQQVAVSKSRREQIVETRLRPGPGRLSHTMLLGALQRLRVVSKNIDQEAHAAATSPHNLRPQPTEGQREAGNYKMGHKSLIGLDLTIENPAGSYRRMEWPIMQAHYGYVKRSLGADGDHVDVFVQRGTPDDWAGTVYVIDQIDESGEFDEVKAMLGFSDQRSAERCYLSHYPPGWKLGPVTAVPAAEFAEWARSDAAQFSFTQWPNASMTPGATTTAERAEALLERAEALDSTSVNGVIEKVMVFPPARLCEFELARALRKAFNEDQPRDEAGRFSSSGDETGQSAPKPGEKFVVYRLGDASVDLTNRNAGNAHAVARHIARSQSAEGPVGVGGVGDTVHAFEVSVGAKFGGFARFNAGNAAEKTGSVVGRDVERGNQVIYSFARGAAYTARPLGSVKLTELNTTLKEKHDAWDFDDAGTNLGARVLREHFKPVGKVLNEAVFLETTRRANVLRKAFNEDQPRDERGRCGDGGAQDGAQGSMKYYELSPAERAVYAQGIKSVADDVAKQFGYPADKIEATIGPSKFFELNGKTYTTAGEAWLESGRIQLYPAALSNVKAVEEVTAHEVGHQLLERVFKAQEAERARMMADPETLAVAFVRNGENVIGPGIRPDGSLRTDALKERYPLYTAQWAVQDSPGTWAKLQKEDGVTQYSRDWWAAHEDGKATAKQAMHETYAEINMLAFTGKRDGKTLTELGVKPAWRKLYANYSKAARGLR